MKNEHLTPYQQDDRYIEPDEMVLRVPVSMIPGEWGDRFPKRLIKVLRVTAELRYAPMDFGLTDGKSYIEVHFEERRSVAAARKETEAFIERGGPPQEG